MTFLKGWRTVLFNLVIGSFLFLNQTLGIEIDVIDASEKLNELDQILIFFWGIGNVILRAITDTPLGDNGQEPEPIDDFDELTFGGADDDPEVLRA